MKRMLLLILILLTVFCMPLAACDNNTDSAQPNPYAGSAAGDVIEFAGYDWQVLEVEDGMALIVSVQLLDDGQYHYPMQKITWAESKIRESLNTYFYDKTFSDEEKARIVERTVINNDNPWYGTPGGENTEDKLFLLSIEELVKYFGDSGMLANRPEDAKILYDEYDEARIASYYRTGIDSWWWLRSPGDGPTQAALVNQFGQISICGFDVMLDDHFPEGRGGIRPALWMKLT